MLIKFLLLALLGLACAAPAPNTKVEPRLAKTLRSKSLVNVFVKFDNGNQHVIHRLRSKQFSTRGEKISNLVAELKSASQSSQMNVVNLLRSPQFAYSAINLKQFWISNELYVKGASVQVIRLLEGLPEVTWIREERIFQLNDLSSEIILQNQTQWNLDKVEAPQAWGLPGGNNGQGVVVGNIDTGVRRTHETLRNNHREDYGWFDPYEGSDEAIDTGGHGTSTMGITVGAGIGVAPGAQWIACRGCNGRVCYDEGLLGCGQWILCPTRANGTQEDCSKAPDIVSNSWGSNVFDDPFYNDIIEAWQAAEIIPVFAIGNGGYECQTTSSPGDQENVIAVGATDEEDILWYNSSVGPAPSGKIKPEIAAPGRNIRSARHGSDDEYGVSSGTSNACPHVTGTIALLLSRNPNLKYEEVKDILERNTDTEGLGNTGMTCGGRNSTTFPNNHYGHGRLNARKALEAVINNLANQDI